MIITLNLTWNTKYISKCQLPVNVVRQIFTLCTLAGEVIFLCFFNYDQAHTRDKETLTQTMPLTHWLQLT